MKPSTTDDVFNVMDSFVSSAALIAAMQLGLFWLLYDQPMDAGEIAKSLEIPNNRCNYWLQILRRIDH